MGEKKVVNVNVAYALGVLCIILVGATVGVVIFTGNTDNNFADSHSHSDSEYAALTAQLAAANENISNLNTQLSSLQSEVTNNSPLRTNRRLNNPTHGHKQQRKNHSGLLQFANICLQHRKP